MPLTPYNFNVEQGDDLIFTVTYTDSEGLPIDLSNALFRMDVKKALNDTHPIWSFNAAGVEVEVDYDGSGPEPPVVEDFDNVTLNGDGVITVRIDRAFTFKPATKTGGSFVYDGFVSIKESSDPDVWKTRKIIEGTINIKRSVTLWESGF